MDANLAEWWESFEQHPMPEHIVERYTANGQRLLGGIKVDQEPDGRVTFRFGYRANATPYEIERVAEECFDRTLDFMQHRPSSDQYDWHDNGDGSFQIFLVALGVHGEWPESPSGSAG